MVGSAIAYMPEGTALMFATGGRIVRKNEMTNTVDLDALVDVIDETMSLHGIVRKGRSA
jgi:hypothetical protein